MPSLSYLTLYKYVSMTALLISNSLFLFRLQRKPRFALRLALCALGAFVLVSLFPPVRYTAITVSIMFGCFFLFSVLMARICYDIDWKSCLLCAVAGYSAQHIASIFYSLITTLGGFEVSISFYSNEAAELDVFTVLIFLQVYALVYWGIYQIFAKKIRGGENIAIKSPLLLGLASLLLLVEIVLNAFVVYHQYDNLDLTYFLCASLTNLLCSICILIMLFGLLMRETLEEELEVVNHMWRQERRQFYIAKETIDMINIKCHDMKHQIHALRKSLSPDPEALREIEKSIDIYSSIVKTGNSTLDIILAEKSFYCQRNDITINCIIDGERLDFMNDVDIYSLFGNLLDNAINSVIQLEPERRVISLSVKARGKLLVINSHNYFDGEVRMENGLPLTSNPDRRVHGFGVKSMSLIARKYGGTISFDARDHVFELNILFPNRESAAEEGAL